MILTHFTADDSLEQTVGAGRGQLCSSLNSLTLYFFSMPHVHATAESQKGHISPQMHHCTVHFRSDMQEWLTCANTSLSSRAVGLQVWTWHCPSPEHTSIAGPHLLGRDHGSCSSTCQTAESRRLDTTPSPAKAVHSGGHTPYFCHSGQFVRK